MFDIPLKQRKRHILHIDADAFFASVEQILNPKLRGLPLLVGGPSSKNGIVSAASYEARRFGIKSGMPMYLAKQKCPKAVVVRGNFEAYRDFSKRMYEVFCKYTPDVQMASIDEAYLDITGCGETWGESAEMLAKSILLEVHSNLGLSVSCGMASSKVVAKVASGLNKPHKLTVVPFGKEADFLAPLSLRAMPGIGPRTCALLEGVGVKKLGDLAVMSPEEVIGKFGLQTIMLWKRCRGVDNSEVVSLRPPPKSISKEHTFYRIVSSKQTCIKQLKEMSGQVFEKLRSHNMKASTIFVKIRYKVYEDGGAKFDDNGFQRHLDLPSMCDTKLFAEAKKLFLENLREGEAVRLVGIGVSGLKSVYNLSLFERSDEEEKLFYAIDKVRKLYGTNVLRHGI
ncbi:DNA polymerase IV [Candidatus Gracilibacteria bacterium]|nr:DNA polymerase IV [Candidatus Gracilibacteria bacterium]